jgi:predicted RNA-binding Zn-ribbon protein involved in translation (DUF1610 family)
MSMYKCDDCSFWGDYKELLEATETTLQPYGNGVAKEERTCVLCPECKSEDIGEWKRI